MAKAATTPAKVPDVATKKAPSTTPVAKATTTPSKVSALHKPAQLLVTSKDVKVQPKALAKTAQVHVNKDNFLDYFTLNGSATYDKTTGIVTITPDQYNQVGNFALDSKIDMGTDFTLNGQVNLGSRTSSQGGADGIGFAFDNGNTTVPDTSSAMAMIVSASTGANKNLQQFKINNFDFSQAATVNVTYVDQQGNTLAKGEVTYPNGAYVNSTYQTQQLDIPNYKFIGMDNGSVTGKASLAASGTLAQAGDNGTVVYVYAPA